jgi:tRNA threonylcarbamoyladenosine biosynthesis protein TsaB
MTKYILALDASTYSGSAALITREGGVVDHAATAMRGEHEERLMPAVADLLRAHLPEQSTPEAIVCGAGPGSFTSLRIAAGIAKGLAIGFGVPLYAVSSLLLIPASAATRGLVGRGRYLSALDALRGEVFVQPCEVTAQGGAVPLAAARLITLSEFSALRREEWAGTTTIGPQQEVRCEPHALGAAVALRHVLDSGEVDAAAWEPDYGRSVEMQYRRVATTGGAGL